MPHNNILAAAAAAHGGLSQADSTTSLQRYEETHASSIPTIISRHVDPDDNASSKLSILPPLTHPCRLSTSDSIAHLTSPPSPLPRRPGFPLNRFPSAAGAEPGVNPRQDAAIAKYSPFKQECLIDVIDYDAEDANIERLGNADFINIMKTGYSKDASNDGLEHHPKAVRWINIGGIDWDVLSSLALRYHVHSLALEDVLHEHRDIQSKADYYPDHLFIRALCHSTWPINDQEDHIQLTGPDHRLRSVQKYTSRPTVPPAYGPEDLESGSFSHRRNTSSASTTFLNPQPERLSSLPILRPLELRTLFSGANAYGADNMRIQEQIVKLRALTAEDRLNIVHEPMYIFLFHDGTVVSIMPTANLDFTSPITERLYHNQSVLRTSEDPSLLVQSLLDLVVDRILEVVDEYQTKIHKLEHDIMLSPKMDSVRSLHVLSGDLIMHKLTLEPIRTMIYNLRRYDIDRCIAMANHIKAEAESSDEQDSDSDTPINPAATPGRSSTEREKSKEKNRKLPKREHSLLSSHWEMELDGSEAEAEGDRFAVPEKLPSKLGGGGRTRKTRKRMAARRKSQTKREVDKAERLRWEKVLRYMSVGDDVRKGAVRGYLSYKCKVYLGDVYDHMDFALTSLDMLTGISENLIDYAFNMASYEMNQVMNRLTIVTIIFLPLTLLTGYFGMNFVPFRSLDGHSETQFWKIAIPAMVALVSLFMFHDIKKYATYVSRRRKSKRACKDL